MVDKLSGSSVVMDDGGGQDMDKLTRRAGHSYGLLPSLQI
jgi:hypothetical protein